MNPLLPPPPGLDFGRIFVTAPPPIHSHLDLFAYLLLLPFELIATHGSNAAVVAVAAVGGLFQLLVLVFVVAALVALLLVLLIGLGVGGMLAAGLAAIATRKRRV